MQVGRFPTILDALAAHAADRPDALAWVAAGESITYGALYQQAQHVARVLASRGVGSGTNVGLRLPTSVGFLRALFGVQLTGAATVALNIHVPEARLERLAAIAGCTTILDEEAMTNLRDAPSSPGRLPAIDPEAIAFLQLTSGTTGEPRAAMVRHRNIVACLTATVNAVGPPVAEEMYVSWLPLYHDFGLINFICYPAYFGIPTHLLLPSLTNLRPWLETVGRVRATSTGGPDFAYRMATRTVNPASIDLRSLRRMSCGGEPVRFSTLQAFEERFQVPGLVRPGYGLAEATLGVCILLPGEPMRRDPSGAVSCGRPYPGIDVRLESDEGTPCAPGEAGEIVVGGKVVFAGYYNDPESTRAVLRAGELYTGDIGRFDADGYLYPLARRRALIKRAGATIAPREVEEVADRVAGVRLSAAIGCERNDAEQLVVVVEVRPEDAPTDDERQRLADRIEEAVGTALGFAPDDVLLVAPRTIPRTANGKIRYPALRALVGEMAAAPVLFSSAGR